MMPCISINMLTCIAFYLPSDSSEKISLCVTVLLSLSMFLLLLMELIPATSTKFPLMGKYILFTLVTVSLSVLVSVITLNMHFRSNATHRMPRCARRLFLNILPRFLLMKRPELKRGWRDEGEEEEDPVNETYWADQSGSQHNSYFPLRNEYLKEPGLVDPLNIHPYGKYGIDPASRHMIYNNPYTLRTTFVGGEQLLREVESANFCRACARKREAATTNYPIQVQMALEGVMFVKEHHKDQDDSKVVISCRHCLCLRCFGYFLGWREAFEWVSYPC